MIDRAGTPNGANQRRRRVRDFALVTIGLAPVVLVACSLINNLDDYTGGPPKDSGVHDGANGDVASETPIDTGTILGDTGTPDDTSTTDDTNVVDDTNVIDDGAGDTGTIGNDTSDTASGDSIVIDSVGVDGDAGPNPLALFGFSEIMPRAVAGNGDFHEWVELTNYDVVPLDVSNVKVVLTTGSGPHTVTIPAGTIVQPGDAIAIGDDDTGLKADVAASGYKAGLILSFGVPGGNIFSNSSALTLDVFSPGATTSYEHAVFPSRSWAAGHSYAYPVANDTCPATGRFNAAGAPTAAWKDVPLDPTMVYGNVPDAGPVYGFPTTPNTGISCP